MNKKIIIIFLVLEYFPFHSPLNAQNLKIGLQTGMGYYKMNELQKLTEDLNDINPLNPKITSNYPPYYYYKPSLIFEFKYINFGFLYTHQSTGARISIKDYSGEYRLDSKIKSNAYGVIYEINLNPQNKIGFRLYSELGIMNTVLDMNEFLKLADRFQFNDKYTYKSKNYYIEPGLKISYTLSFISTELNLGYFKQFGKKTLGGSFPPLADIYGEEIKPDWSGWRYGLSIFFVIPLKYK